MKKFKIDAMIMATLLSTLFYSATYPRIHQIVVSNVSSELISISQIVNCLGIIFSCQMWNKKSDRLYNKYVIFCVLEPIAIVASTTIAIVTENITAYYIIDMLSYAVITNNVIRGAVKLKTLRYKDPKHREVFDNNSATVSSVATIIGSVISIILDLNFEVMLIIATIGNMVDNIFYIVIYLNGKKK